MESLNNEKEATTTTTSAGSFLGQQRIVEATKETPEKPNEAAAAPTPTPTVAANPNIMERPIETPRSLADVPTEILADILSLLSPLELIHVAPFVCKYAILWLFLLVSTI